MEECARVNGRECPKCARKVKTLFAPHGAAPACRYCHALINRSKAQSGTTLARVRKSPELLAFALDDAALWIEGKEGGTADAGRFNDAMNIITATNEIASEPKRAALSSEIFEGLTVPDDASLQERVTAQDVTRATALIERVESIIESGEENHVDRLGVVSKVPLRVDSFSKLGHLWIALSNLRAARAGLATTITEQREVKPDKMSFADVSHDPEAMAAVLLLTERMAKKRPQLENEK